MNLPGGPTQPEVMAVSLAKLGIRPGDTVADIGCGTGTVTAEMAKQTGETGIVYGIDRRAAAMDCMQESCGRYPQVRTFAGEALDFFRTEHLPVDCAFFGGSRDLSALLTTLNAEGCRSIVVNAVLLETAVEAVHTMKTLEIFREAVHLQLSRSHELTGRIMFQPINPVYIIHGGHESGSKTRTAHRLGGLAHKC